MRRMLLIIMYSIKQKQNIETVRCAKRNKNENKNENENEINNTKAQQEGEQRQTRMGARAITYKFNGSCFDGP